MTIKPAFMKFVIKNNYIIISIDMYDFCYENENECTYIESKRAVKYIRRMRYAAVTI